MVHTYTNFAGLDLPGFADVIRIPGHTLGHSAAAAAEEAKIEAQAPDLTGVADGIRTHNNWNHNPGLYR